MKLLFFSDSGYGSTDPIEYGSNPDPKHCFKVFFPWSAWACLFTVAHSKHDLTDLFLPCGKYKTKLAKLAAIPLIWSPYYKSNSRLHMRHFVRSTACEMQTPMLGGIAQKRHMVIGGRAWEYKGLYSLTGL